MDPIFKNLNEKQMEAVKIINGPLLIIAGAGSGKTRTLAHKVAYLIEKGVAPNSILAITFTNKAAQEMRERIELLIKLPPYLRSHFRAPNTSLDTKLPIPIIGTFHSICAKILRNEAEFLEYKNNFVIYDEDDQSLLIKDIIEIFNINKEKLKIPYIKNLISAAKNELINPEEYGRNKKDYLTKIIKDIYILYQKKLKESNAMDFDDLIFNTIYLFRNHPEILKKYQNKFKYILVDEYQDTNYSQYILLKELAAIHKNICVVGDIDQSIYEWRGANFRNILNFEKDYPETKIILLEENYRSTKNILTAANQVIEKNTLRKEKNLWTKKEVGEKIKIILAKNEIDEAEFIVKEIINIAKNKKIKLNDMAILIRTGAQSRAIEESLIKYSLPYKIIGGIKFYARKEIKDIISYLRFIKNNNDLISLKRIINTPPRGLGKQALQIYQEIMSGIYLPKNIKKNNKKYPTNALSNKKLEKINNFNLLIKTIGNELKNSAHLSQFLKMLIDKIDYKNYLLDGTKEGEQRFENIKELINVASLYDKTEKTVIALDQFLENVALLSAQDEIDEKKNAISVMTMHAAKGLEFNIIFMAGMEENIFPHQKSMASERELEEERRLCYVGITRAKELLYLIFSKNRRYFGTKIQNPPSRFLLEIPGHLVDFMETSSKSLPYEDEMGKTNYIEID